MTNPIYIPKGRAKEYGDYALNIYTGCTHRCSYCFAPSVLHVDREKFYTDVRPREGIVEAVKKQLTRGHIKGQLIHLCFTCDPYPADVDTSATREIIRAIKKSGNHVQILTKGGSRADRDFDLLDGGDWFGVTFSGNQSQCFVNEPNASTLEERDYSAAVAHSMGIKTWISCEPVYSEAAVYSLISSVGHYDLYKIGKLNYHASDIDWGAFGRECERLCKLHGRSYYIKDDLRKEMEVQT